ncbi:oxidoreductase / NAD-binding Rossmann fold family protein [Synechococcus sp. BIOS-U3-1]|uniref:bi-domain-containing oxidoreductase n=1 Tax=Synechococcus sp. BIOS-U3-1 TaxID=1400865 RepID=UPI0016462F3E|nr:bi-domain-containing oxidoreductase [Synechococcus sp. BIOS-U3-1]QNI57187.1 oxidoreductase / NAD-binding Rossmann fold family protein [Synechococcus sp. BIOS-U3-1]
MKQLLHSLATGASELPELPAPVVPRGHLLIRSSCSLVSAGTERMLVDFGSANWIGKARQQPAKVQQVLEKARTDGPLTTLDAVRSKLDQPLPLGYCNVGTVVAVGSEVSGFQIGDKVASNGAHAELVSVSHLLCAVIPTEVSDEAAAFTVLSSIGLQGTRLANPTLGETFVVSGLGLIGLLTGQLLAAQGCRVLGLDPDPSKCALAETLGIMALHLSSGVDPVAWCLDHTAGIGVDGVLITAATSSTEPVHVAAGACRQRGRIVLVGVTGLELRRDLFYKKELSFQVSCSYGPGRYDPAYEQQGHDYPIGFVRWTQQRNFQAVLHALASGALRTEPLISHRFSFEQASDAYELLSSAEPSLGILLRYPETADPEQRLIQLPAAAEDVASTKPLLSVIGAGNFASRVLIPAFTKVGAGFYTIAASSGIGPVHLGRKFGFRQASTDVPALLVDPNYNTLVIATRHDSHALLVQQALAAGKNVFVEKPLCLTVEELSSIQAAFTGEQLLMVGYNRRFAPLSVLLQQQLSRSQGPKAFVYTCNAGAIPVDHWTQDPSAGGGRMLGEACHFVDLLRHLAASPIEDLQLFSAADSKPCPDTFSLQLRFADGSIGTVHYFANGSKAFPKERLEVFVDGKIFRLDNYLKLKAWGIPGFRTRRLLQQDKGQVACCAAFLTAIETGGSPPIPTCEIFEVQRWLLEAVNQ